MKKIATRYAVALFDLAIEENKLSEYEEQLLWIQQVFDDEAVFQFFSSVKIDEKDKVEVLSKLLSEHLDAYVMNFLKLLIDKSRMFLIRSIVDEFHLLTNQHNNIQEGVVYSIRKLSQEEHQQIEQAVGERLQAKVVLKNYIKPSLLSGVRIVIKDTVIDASMQSKMNQLKSQLLKESR